MVVLALITLACLFGPYATGHGYDHVYQDYVRQPAGLAALPRDGEVGPAAERIAARIRARAEDVRATLAPFLRDGFAEDLRFHHERGLPGGRSEVLRLHHLINGVVLDAVSRIR